MRLTVLVPAFNESASIADVLKRIPKNVPGFSTIDTVVVDDGSTDGTGNRARAAGASVLRHPERLGLAAAFRTGLSEALARGVEYIATVDADGQYRPEELLVLADCAMRTKADLVVGNRQVMSRTHMPIGNRLGNVLGSFMLRFLGAVDIADASSGFRLFTSRLGRALQIRSSHTYTHEMLIQAGAYGFSVSEVPVSFLPRKHGQSKLVRTLRHHILRSCGTILRSLFLYAPLKKFLILSLLSLVIATLLGIIAALRTP